MARKMLPRGTVKSDSCDSLRAGSMAAQRGRERAMKRAVHVLVLVGAMVLVLGACDWAQFRYGPTHTAFNPESGLTPNTVSGVATATWTAAMPDGASASSPVVANGVAYVSTQGGGLFAFDATGTACTQCDPMWSASVGPQSF